MAEHFGENASAYLITRIKSAHAGTIAAAFGQGLSANDYAPERKPGLLYMFSN